MGVMGCWMERGGCRVATPPSFFPALQVVAPTISSPVCQEQLIEAGKLVAKSAEGCVEASKAATNDDQLLKQVGVAATAVTQALNDLLQHIKQHATGGQPIGRYDQATDTILNVTENIFSSMGDAGKSERLTAPGDGGLERHGEMEQVLESCLAGGSCLELAPAVRGWCSKAANQGNSQDSLTATLPSFLGEMVRQARILAQATSDLVNAIKADAEGETDLENSRKLLSAAKILADATAKMVEAAKVGGRREEPLEPGA